MGKDEIVAFLEAYAQSFTPPVREGVRATAVERDPAGAGFLVRTAEGAYAAEQVVVATGARVALGDEVGALLRARAVAVLIGERPGLSSPDSLGVYLTYQPKVGRTDAERNCISNIRPEGLGYAEAARKLNWLARAALARGVTGVALKDDSQPG